ncbi:protein C10 [Megachile rotundata]|uniref:protein C10 n=1 Tax=Megachile rotundata TaxID=143995 RepID=UPI000258F589|nr:PREDICTED: protein C10-like [Megachile rotundata]
MTSLPIFTPEIAKAVLTDVLSALNAAENIQKLAEAEEKSGNGMLNRMQFVFPVIIQIQMDVIKKYGFSEGREGIVLFTQQLRAFERKDPEIAQLHSQVRSYFLPPVTRSSSTEASL